MSPPPPPHRPRWMLIAAVCAAAAAALAAARPAVDSGEPEDESGESAVPSAYNVPMRLIASPDSAFGRVLGQQLAAMTEPELAVLERGLPPLEGRAAAALADDEMMMADMPSSADDPPEATESGLHLAALDPVEQARIERESAENASTKFEDRSKKLRIQTIQSQIINYLGLTSKGPTLNPPNQMVKVHPGSSLGITTAQQNDAFKILVDKIKNFPAYPTDMYTEKIQSFYPICDLPRNTNEEMWISRDSMNLLFNISLSRASNGVSININSAKLRLFKQLISCNSQTSNETTDDPPSCQPVVLGENIRRPFQNQTDASLVPLILEEKQIRITIYAYTKSLKRKRVKRKLLDSSMLPYFGEKWTEWNIRGAVKTWRRDPNRNYGISIEVEDEDGNLLPAQRFFRPMNCSEDAQMTTPKPIPGFLGEAMHGTNISLLRAFGFNTNRYPMIDVSTVEVPDSEANAAMLYQYQKYVVEQNLAAKLTPTALPPQHRIRHNNSQHRTDLTDDSESKEFRSPSKASRNGGVTTTEYPD